MQEESNMCASLASTAPKLDTVIPNRVPCRPDHPIYVHLKTWLSMFAPGADLVACSKAALTTLCNVG